MRVTRKTCWVVSIIASVFCAINFGMFAMSCAISAVSSISALAIGTIMLLFASTEKTSGTPRKFFVASAICVLLSMANGWGGFIAACLIFPLGAQGAKYQSDCVKSKLYNIICIIGIATVMFLFLPSNLGLFAYWALTINALLFLVLAIQNSKI